MPYGLLLFIEPIKAASFEEVMARRKPSPWNYIDTYRDGECEMAFGVSLRIDCPHCYHPNVFKDPEENQGAVINCESRHCSVIFKAYNCPYCSHLHSICECRHRFNDKGYAPCWNEDCRKEICNLKCPHCSGFNFVKHPDDLRAVSYTCTFKTCKKTSQIFERPHCDMGGGGS